MKVFDINIIGGHPKVLLSSLAATLVLCPVPPMDPMQASHASVKWLMRLNVSALSSDRKAVWWDCAATPPAQNKKNKT